MLKKIALIITLVFVSNEFATAQQKWSLLQYVQYIPKGVEEQE